MEFLGSIAIALVIYLGGNEVIRGHISVGAFFFFYHGPFYALYADQTLNQDCF